MQLANIDMIVKRSLLEKRLPLHFYVEFLSHAAACIRDLTKDTLQVINVANLPVSSYGSIDLPSDFVDDLAVCMPVGDTIIKLPKQDWLTPIRRHDTNTGEFVPYANLNSEDEENTVWGIPTAGYNYFWNIDDWGGNTGRNFGSNGGISSGYKVVKERRQIQMTEDFIDGNVVLLYLSNGQSSDNATQVEWMAFSCIQSYIDWKTSRNASLKDSAEARTYYNEKRLLKSALNELTKTDLINVLRSAYTATIKN